MPAPANSLFVRPEKFKETAEERRLWLLKDRAELGEAIGKLGKPDPLLVTKRELEQALKKLVAERSLSEELQTLVDRIRPIGEIHFPKKDVAHIDQMLADIDKGLKDLPKGTQTIAGLLGKLKLSYLQEQKRDPATASEFSCALHGVTSGYRYVDPKVMDKLLPRNENGEVAKSMRGVQGGGTRAVNQHENIFCKDAPEAPSYQFGWDTLLQVFCDDQTAASQFARAHRMTRNGDTTYETQTSLAVKGDMSFSKLVTEHPHLLDKLDLSLFGKTIIAHILGMPQDATENNYMALFTKEGDNIVNVRWKGFDDDRWGVDSPARSGKDFHFNNMRSFFLCCKQMYQPIQEDVRKHFEEMNPARAVLQFLKEMTDYNQRLKELQKKENIPQEKIQEMHLRFLMVKDLIPRMYRKLCCIQAFMRRAGKEKTQKTHMDMWLEVDPVLANFYDLINQKYPKDPYQAFLKIFYRAGPTIEETMASFLSRPLVNNISLSEHLKTCNKNADDYEALRDTPPELAAEQWLESELNFGIFSAEEQNEILEGLQAFPLTAITLRNCSAIRDVNIRALLEKQPDLQKLTLRGCDKLTNAALNTIFQVHPHLELTLINCPGFTPEKIGAFKSKNIKVSQSDQPEADLQAVPEGFEEQMKVLSSALQAGDWKLIMEKHGALKAAGIGDKAEIQIINHLIKTDQMRQIVKENRIEALEFLKQINFKFTDKNIQEECLFHLCCQEGNAPMLKWLCGLQYKWEEIVDQTGSTPWHAAVASGNLACLQVLKEAKAPISLQNKARIGPLRMALERKDEKIAKSLVEMGADAEETNWRKQNLLHVACQHGLMEFVELLLKRAPKLADSQDDMGKSPLHCAIEFGQAECFQKVLKVMNSVQSADEQGNTPLMLAAQFGHHEMVRALLAKGADPKETNKKLSSPNGGMNTIQIAVLVGSLSCVKAMLGDKPSLQALSILREKDNKTLLHLAVLSGSLELVQWLARPELLTKLDAEHLTAAHYAAQLGKKDIFFALVKAGFPINFQETPKKETCLMLALRAHHCDLAEEMIKPGGARLDLPDSSGLFPIHRAAQAGDASLIPILVTRFHCDVNLTGKDINAGRTALHFAASLGHTEVMKQLFSQHANCDVMTLDKQTPLLFAVKNGREEAVRLLVAKGSDRNVKDSDSSTLIHCAARFCQPKLLAYLLSLQPELIHSKTEQQGHTPLHSAMYQLIDTFEGPPAEKERLRQRQLEVVKILLRYGAEVDARDIAEFTPLHLTGKWGRPDFARLLLSRGANVFARYDKSGGKRIPEECKTPEEHCYFTLKFDLPPEIRKGVEETAQVLKEHAKSLQNSQKALKKGHSLFANEKTLADMLQKPLEQRTKQLFTNQKNDGGNFSPESLMLLRSIENELASQPKKLQETVKGWAQLIPDEAAAYSLIHRYEMPLTTLQIRESWLSSDNSRHLDEIACMIPLIGEPGDIIQKLVEMSESTNPALTEKETKSLFALMGHLRKHDAWSRADFPKAALQRLTATLGKHKKGPLKDVAVPAKEFLEDLATHFPKVVLENDWKEKGLKDRRQKLLSELSEALNHSHKREELINQLTRTIMGLNKDLFQKVKISDFRNPTNTALSELQRTSKDLTANCLIFLLQDGGYEAIGQRLEFVIDWMAKSALYGDFHQTAALFEAISHPALSRLKKAFDHLNNTSKELLLRLEKLFLPESDYENYFACLNSRLSPSIPSMSILTRVFAQKQTPEGRYGFLRNLQAHRTFVAKLNLPPTNSSSDFLLPLTSELYPQEYKKGDAKPGESFAWERSIQLKPRVLKSRGSFLNHLLKV